MTHPAKHRIVTADSEFEALLRPWQSLRQATSSGSVLQAPAVLWRWWRAFGQDLELRIVCAWRGAELVGVLPLQRNRRWISARRYHLLEFLGMPNELCRPEPLLATGDTGALEAIASGIVALDADWQLVQLDELDRDAWWLMPLRRILAERGYNDELRYQHDCPSLINTTGLAGFLATRSRRFAKRMRTLERRLAERGSLRVESMHGEAGAVANGIETFFDVERRSWKAHKQLDTGRDPDYRRFVESLADLGHAGIRRHAFVLSVDTKAVAATIGVSERDRYYGLQIAHDVDYDAYSPGTLLEWNELQWFFEKSGLETYEFLGGGQGNKTRWTDRAMPTYRLTAGRFGPHWRLRSWYKHTLVPTLRASRRQQSGRDPN